MYAFIYVQKEQENDSTVSTELGTSNESYHQDQKLFEDITPEPTENDFTKLSALNGQELSLSDVPLPASASSISESSENSISNDSVGISSLIEKAENELNTTEKSTPSDHSDGNQSLNSAEPSK